MFKKLTDELYNKVTEPGLRKGIRLAQKYVKEASDPRHALIILIVKADEDRRNKIKTIERTHIVDAISACLAILGSVERKEKCLTKMENL